MKKEEKMKILTVEFMLLFNYLDTLPKLYVYYSDHAICTHSKVTQKQG